MVNALVATDWLWVRFDPVYRFVWEISGNDLMTGLAYHVETGGMEWNRNRVHFSLITLTMLRVLGTCIYALHDTSLDFFFVSSRTGRTSIGTSDCQHVHSVRRFVANYRAY